MIVQSSQNLNAAPGTNGAVNESSGSYNFMDGTQFMQLLLAQLRNQNPLEPLEDREMMGQLTQLNSLQELQKINQSIQDLASANQLGDAAGLIGKTVQFSNGEEETSSGVVTGISLVEGQVMLWVGERSFPLTSLIAIQQDQEEGAGDD
jgi:flagellar basal-body rod modification protein FlgD